MSKAEVDAWVLETLPLAVAYATSLLNDRSLAEDVVHDCYCRLLPKNAVYDLKQDGTKLLFKSLTNACLNFNTRRRGHVSLQASGPGNLEIAATLADRREAAPSQSSLIRELECRIADGLRLLPLVQRAALELKSLGHSLQQIGEALETSPTNAGVLIHRARQSMARHLADYLQEKPR